jgi:hypothetical protein
MIRQICNHAHLCDGAKYGCGRRQWHEPEKFYTQKTEWDCADFPDRVGRRVKFVTFDELIEGNK